MYRLAVELGLSGSVANDSLGVIVDLEGPADRLDRFQARLVDELPPLASIETLQVTDLAVAGATGFHIDDSRAEGAPAVAVSVDVATCADCERELLDPADRRYGYPFVNCTNCGPRYTIIRSIPYDRRSTTMAGFVMCDDCRAEYTDPADRRFHAEPIACPVCGPQLSLLTPEGGLLAKAGDALDQAVALLAEGRILAIKGLGGYHLAVDATNAEAVAELRRRKARDDKPFAVMVADIDAARAVAVVTPEAEAALTSPRRPIVLLVRDDEAGTEDRLAPGIAPRLPELGLMLPVHPAAHPAAPPVRQGPGHDQRQPVRRAHRPRRHRRPGPAGPHGRRHAHPRPGHPHPLRRLGGAGPAGGQAMFQLGVAMRWSVWQSRAAAGGAGERHEPDLPGILTRLRFPDGPPLRDQGRVCLIHDTADGRWGATARLTHSGVGMLSDADCERLAAQLGMLLIAIGHREVVDRMSLLVRTVPDDGAEYDVWRASHEDPRAPGPARAATDELDHAIGSVSVRTELFVTVSGTEAVLRRPAQAAGGGIAGRAYALYRVLDGVDDQLKSLGVRSVNWLTSPALAEAIRTGFNPAAAAGFTSHHLIHPDPAGESGLAMSQAGPTLVPSPAARSYTHDGFSSVAYSVLPPESGTVFGSLGPLLAVRTAGERRTVAIHYEVLSRRAANRAVRTNRFRHNVLADYKSQKGFSATAVDSRRASGARAQESAIAAGHSMVRYTIASAITVPADWNLEDHAAKLENDASGRFRLLRLELAQDSAFVAAAVPLGIGLPRLRGAWD